MNIESLKTRLVEIESKIAATANFIKQLTATVEQHSANLIALKGGKQELEYWLGIAAETVATVAPAASPIAQVANVVEDVLNVINPPTTETSNGN